MPPTENKKSNKTLVILIIILILSLALFCYVFFLKNKKIDSPVVGKPEITEAQKIEILNKLKVTSNTPSVTLKEKQQILKELETASAKQKPLTEEEKIKILNSLNN